MPGKLGLVNGVALGYSADRLDEEMAMSYEEIMRRLHPLYRSRFGAMWTMWHCEVERHVRWIERRQLRAA